MLVVLTISIYAYLMQLIAKNAEKSQALKFANRIRRALAYED